MIKIRIHILGIFLAVAWAMLFLPPLLTAGDSAETGLFIRSGQPSAPDRYRIFQKMTTQASSFLSENINKVDNIVPLRWRKVTADDLYRIMLPGMTTRMEWSSRLQMTAFSARSLPDGNSSSTMEAEAETTLFGDTQWFKRPPAAVEEERPILVPSSYKQNYSGLLSLSLPILATKSVIVKPTVTYCFAQDGATRRALQNRGLSPDSFVYGGLSVFFSF